VLFWVMSLRPPTEIPNNARIVPDVSDMSWERAEQLLLEQDLDPTRSDESNADVAEGNVIRTDPAAAVSVSPGQAVTVYVSAGVETATVPTLTGLSEEEARQALGDAGLRVGVITQNSDPSASGGTVLSASEDEGESVPTGTAVDLVVATGTVTIVDFTGYTVDAATRQLESDTLRLAVIVAEDPDCAATSPTTVIRQSLAPGDVPVGSEIELVTCSGGGE
jgi:eukaryotic-like serine/threonine-protein kinase